MTFNYPEILELKNKGFCIIRNFIDVSDSEKLIQDIEAELIPVEFEGASERIEKAGYEKFGCVDFLNPFVSRFLNSKILDDLNQLAGKPNYFKRIPYYKRLTRPSGDDIVYKWHLDREKPLYSMLFYLTDVDETTPHTQVFEKIRWFEKLFPLKDPRQRNPLGKLYLSVSKLLRDPISCYGKKGDLLILNNGEVLHRAHYDKTVKISERINLHVALTPRHVSPHEYEKLRDINALEKNLGFTGEAAEETIKESLKYLIPSQKS